MVISRKQIEVGTRNLIPNSERTPEQLQRMRSNGGKGNKNNPKSIIAARIREMKKRGMTDADSQRLIDMMQSSELAAMHIMEYLNKIIATTTKGSEMNAVAKTVIDWYKIKHGTAESNKKIQIDINVLTPEEREKEVIRLLDMS